MAAETHTDFEIAIERELHGALGEDEAKPLADHLLGCETCRAYQQTARRMETHMTAMSSTISRTFLHEALADRVRTAVRNRSLNGLWTVGAYPAAVVTGYVMQRPIFWPGVIAMALTAFVVGVIQWRREQRKLEMVGHYDEGELFEKWRTQAIQEASDVKDMARLLVGGAVLLAAAFVYFKPTTHHVSLYVSLLVLLALHAVRTVMVYRRIKHQLPMLG